MWFSVGGVPDRRSHFDLPKGTAMSPGFTPRHGAAWLLLFVIGFGLFSSIAAAQHIPITSTAKPEGPSSEPPGDYSINLQLLFVLTVLALLPSLLISTTSFIRISIVLGFLRRALGTQQTPSNQILVAISLFLTIFIMSGVWERVNRTAIQPYLRGEIKAIHPGEEAPDLLDGKAEREILPFEVMVRKSLLPIREFMWYQLGSSGSEVAMFMVMARLPKPKNMDEVPTVVLIPAFMLSELKKAFIMGFVIYIPFVVLDIVTASVTISMGMFMLPPALLSLPFKVMLFTMIDGWTLLVKALGFSFYQHMPMG
jgi:flagellar biosynthetic protein FliP